MRLPSIDRAVEGARRAFLRFPMVILSGIATAGAAMVVIDASDPDRWVRLGAAASLGLPLFTALSFLGLRRGLGPPMLWALRAAGLLVLAVFWWRWAGWSEEVAALRYFHLSAALHLLVAFVAYLGVREHNGFWQFNRALFLRFLTGGIYSAVLFAGLAIALAGVDNLFGVDVAEEAYFRLWAFIAFVFHTWFFTAGIPQDFAGLEELEEYPGGLRAFSQYVLLPLVTVYLLILTAYLGRVLVTRVWPSGWIGYLVSALAALGILSLLLVHPLREREGYAWIDRYARVFWVAILPSVVMLLLAVWQRIDQYGITERRYLLAALAVWLAAVAVYFAVSRSRNIKAIPASLALVAIVTLVGPLSAYAVSLRSQMGRLAELLERHGALVDGRISAVSGDVPVEDRREITGALGYLIMYHGTREIDDWFPEGIAAIDTIANGTGSSNRYEAEQRAALLVRHLGMDPVAGPADGISDFRHYHARPPRPALDVSEFELAWTNVSLDGLSREIDGDTYALSFGGDGPSARLEVNELEVLSFPIDALIDRIGRVYTRTGGTAIPPDSLVIEHAEAGYGLRIHVTGITVDARGDSTAVSGATGDVLLRRPAREPPDP